LPKYFKNAKLLPMSPNIEAELADIKAKLAENTRILKKLESSHRWTLIVSLVKWLVYIGIIIGTYAILQPYLEQMLNVYSGIQDSAETFSDIKAKTSGFDFNSILDLLK
jgi:hypothetical protein